MGETKELNIKNQTYYYFDDMINIRKFKSDLLKIDKKLHRDFDIYYTGYITIKKFENLSDYKNIYSVNPLYLIIHSATGYFKEKNGEKYLVLNSTDKYEEVFSGIKSEIETINGGEKMYYGENYKGIGVNTNDDVRLNKQLKFSTLTIIIKCVFQKSEKLDPLIYLDECLYQL